MRILREEGIVAKKIREVEEFLREKGISISFRGDGLLIDVADETFVIREGESGDLLASFPAEFDGTRIQTIDDYIYGV